MRLSDYKGEEALILLADLLDPVSRIVNNPEVKETYQSKKQVNLELVKVILKSNSRDVIEIMAMLDGQDPNEYEVSVVTLPVKLLELLNDPALVGLFKSQGQSSDKTSSGSAMGNTEAGGL